ncbi:MAG: hypothetical protein OXF08_08280 [Bacteroidetes bacterium]|nr:hypothetical protein [Bacteroidota bacterium]
MYFIFSFLSFALMSGSESVHPDSLMFGQLDSRSEITDSPLLFQGSEENSTPPPFYKYESP